jgi:hypothetical protein
MVPLTGEDLITSNASGSSLSLSGTMARTDHGPLAP